MYSVCVFVCKNWHTLKIYVKHFTSLLESENSSPSLGMFCTTTFMDTARLLKMTGCSGKEGKEAFDDKNHKYYYDGRFR